MRSKKMKGRQSDDVLATIKIKLRPEEFEILQTLQLPFPLEIGDFEVDQDGDPMQIIAPSIDVLGDNK